jgi:hypothetical protein
MFLKGSVTGERHVFNEGQPAGHYSPCPGCLVPYPATPSSSSTDRWQVSNLELKRSRVKVMRSQIQVVYRIVGGTVTWSHEDNPPHCPNFTETFSLKIAKWDIDSRITFFAPKTGRYKNRWRMDGLIDSMHEGPCSGIRVGSLAWLSVGQAAPIARPGKTVRITSVGHDVSGARRVDSKSVLAVRIPR